jgi:hypothetical protein
MDALHVARLEDLPYNDSPPVQFVYEQTATLNAGIYNFVNTTPQDLKVLRPVLENVLYYFRNVTLTADIENQDFTSAITNNIQFQLYRTGNGLAPLFREAILMNQFFQQLDYRFNWFSNISNDVLKGSFSGTLKQTPALIGKGSITLKAVIIAQEIVDEQFIKAFKMHYPEVSRGY